MPVGNGPFKMSEPWKHDQYIKVVANGDYYGKKPNIDGVDFMIFKDLETAYREFQAGNLDFTQIPDGQIEAAKTSVRRLRGRLHRPAGQGRSARSRDGDLLPHA